MNTPDVGAMHIRTALLLVAFSIVLAILIFFGFIKGSYWVAAIPAFYAWARASVFRLISDATYHAHHRFDRDVEDDIEMKVGVRMNEAVTLDAAGMLRNLHIDDERAGRA
jgi:hypothetical protein